MNTGQAATGILSNTFSGVVGGASLGPVGAIAGGVLGLATSLFGMKAQKEQENAVKAQEERIKMASMPSPAASMSTSQYKDRRPSYTEDKFSLLSNIMQIS